ncbi:MAG: DEAD/DEAH box helicase, partial [Bacilli bacterium]
MSTIFDKIKNNDVIAHLEKKDGRFVVQDSLSLALTVGTLYSQKPQRLCVVSSNLYSAQQVYESLVSLLGEEHVLFFPQDEVLRLDVEAYSKEMLAQRLYVLGKCLENKSAILVCHVASLTRYLPEKKLFEKNSLHFEVGKSYSIDGIIRKLIALSFTRVNKIDQSLQFALRGDILDIFPINQDNPIRIEFFDDEIESIRFFSMNDQLSIKNIDKVDIYPATDLLLDDEDKNNVASLLEAELVKCKDKIPYDAYLNLDQRIRNDIDEIVNEGIREKDYKYYSFIYKHKCNILDYFNPDLTIVYDKEKCDNSYEFLISQSYLYYSELCKAGLALSSYNLFDDYLESLEHSHRNLVTHSTYEGDNDVELGIRAVTNVAPNIMKSIDIINEYIDEGKKVIVCLDDVQYETYKLYLDDANEKYEEILFSGFPSSSLALCHYKLSDGFELIKEKIIYLSAKEIFGYKPSVSKFLHRYKQAKVIKSYEELEIGDYVVHEESGIGRFEGIVTLKTLDVHKDFLKIHYAGSDVLYVPLEQFKLVRKFVSKEGAVPKINKLNGTDWARTKNRIKDKINNLAERLLLLYAQRNAELGFAFKEDDEFQKAFEKAFPFPLTDDQEKAVEDIKKDMMSPHPMDRLLCGDVGFGKTEVAFRAAFKAILSGAQVALLCPTTLLARQHYERALERFSLFGVRIAMFSRFVPLSEQKKLMQDIKDEKVHLIIGTHRLLSKEIVIPKLKLLIVDEEQRFGVEHKERIKEVARGIDVLTLSATPIPRTLQMSLLGI